MARALTHQMNKGELLERVERCRRLARSVGDDRTMKALLDLAQSYRRQAEATREPIGGVRSRTAA